jgi:hypothetical protein
VLNEDQSHDLFVVNLGGALIYCESLDDAVAVRTANDVLSLHTESDYTPRELDRLAGVLNRYGHDAEAETLSHLSGQQRAAAFLAKAVGYERPPHHVES